MIIIVLSLSCVTLFACRVKPSETPVTVSGISVLKKPKQYYDVSEAVNIDGGVLTVSYSDGTTGEVSFGDAAVKVTHYGTNIDNRVENMTITYAGFSAKVPYYTSSTVTGVTLEAGTMQSKYSVGAAIDYGSAKFVAKLKGGSTASYPLSAEATRKTNNFATDGFSTTAASEKSTVKFTYFVTEFTFDYMVAADKFALTNIVVGSPETLYIKGEELKLGDTKIASGLSDGTSVLTDVTVDMVSGFDTTTVGKRKMTVNWNGLGTTNDVPLSQEIEYTVYDEDDIESIAVEVYTGEANYWVNEAFKLQNTVIKVNFGNNVIKSVPYTDAAVSLKEGTFSTATGGTFTMTLTYTTPSGIVHEKDVEYIVTRRIVSEVVNNAESIVDVYDLGDDFDFGSATVTITWDDGTTSVVNLSDQFALTTGRLVGFYTRPTPSSYLPLTSENIDMVTLGEHVFYIGYAGRDIATVRYEVY